MADTDRAATATKVAETPTTHIAFLLDRTGSMANKLEHTIHGFNAYVDELRTDPEIDYRFTLCQFDSESFDVLVDGGRLDDVPRLNRENFVPRGMTPLLDASADIIRRAERVEADRHLVVILTDGDENTSKRTTYGKLKELISLKKSEGWQFLFLGANIDAYADAGRVGIARHAVMSYGRGEEATRSAYASVARATASAARGEWASFTAEDKAAAGDDHDREA